MSEDIYGEALLDFYEQRLTSPLLLHSSYGDTDEMPLDIFFRDEDEFSELEAIALSLCDGTVLDVGAGVGSHALYLQDNGFNVDALEVSSRACGIMKKRKVHNVLEGDFYNRVLPKYDTLLFLMNGIGISGTLENFRYTLNYCRQLLTEKGQLLFDTSDIDYLYTDYDIQLPQHYRGEISFQYEYKGLKGAPFDWLYLDQQTLIDVAHQEGWVVQILYEDDQDQYLVRMETKK